jgi:hypothetical protein
MSSAKSGVIVTWDFPTSARSSSCDVDENDGEASAAEGACKLGAVADDVADWMYGGHGDDTFLQVDDDQGGGGVQLG